MRCALCVCVRQAAVVQRSLTSQRAAAAGRASELQAQLAALLYNSSAREGFISAFVDDAIQNGYDGYTLVK